MIDVRNKDITSKPYLRFIFLMVALFFLFQEVDALAASGCNTPECLYTKANQSYNTLLKTPKLKNRRDNWLNCINDFQKVYKKDPKGAWAPAGLYMSGLIYKNLYQYSKNPTDLENAIDNLNKASVFKKTRFSLEATKLLRSLPEKPVEGKKPAEPTTPTKDNSKKAQKEPDEKAKHDKTKPSEKVSSKSSAKKDVSTENTTSSKPPTESAGKIASVTSSTAPNSEKRPSESGSSTKGTSKKDRSAPSSSTKQSLVKALRHASLPTRTRIVIDTDTPVTYTHELTKDQDSKALQHIDIEIKNSRLAKSVKPEVTIDDDRVKSIHTSGKTGNTAKISINIKTYKDYKIFSLRNPSRVVVDVWGQSSASSQDDDQETEGTIIAPPPNNAIIAPPPPSNTIIEASDLTRQLQLGVKRIVIDPGHGGIDHGAPGYEKGFDEKDVVLSIGKKLAAKITKELGLEVIMTRSDDTYITLEERTQIANRNKADLFISIHANSSLNKKANGIETYFLNLARDKDSVAVAARENATSEKNISDLQSILDSLMRNTKITESSKLATYVQDSICKGLKKKYSPVKNKGVKQAPFYVLLGARMPAILVETSFISNKRECELLSDDEYQDLLCDSIIDGIKTYIRKTSPPVGPPKKR